MIAAQPLRMMLWKTGAWLRFAEWSVDVAEPMSLMPATSCRQYSAHAAVHAGIDAAVLGPTYGTTTVCVGVAALAPQTLVAATLRP